jgi:hypothetical protein
MTGSAKQSRVLAKLDRLVARAPRDDGRLGQSRRIPRYVPRMQRIVQRCATDRGFTIGAISGAPIYGSRICAASLGEATRPGHARKQLPIT